MRKRHRHTGTCRPEGPPSGAKLLTNDKWGPKRWQPAAFCTPPASRLQAMLCLSPPSRRRRINYAWEARRWELRGIWWVINGGLMHIHCRKHKEILGEGGKKNLPEANKDPVVDCILTSTLHSVWHTWSVSVQNSVCVIRFMSHSSAPRRKADARTDELLFLFTSWPLLDARSSVIGSLGAYSFARQEKVAGGACLHEDTTKKERYELWTVQILYQQTNKSIIFQIKPSQVLWLRWIQEQPSIKSVFMYQVFIYEEIMKSNWKWVICLYSKKA